MTRTTCEELSNRIVDYVDGELPADEARIVARHVNECPRCRQIANDLQRSLGLARTIWQDNLAAAAPVRRSWKVHRGLFCGFAVAASVLFAASVLMMPVLHQSPKSQIATAKQIEQQVARVGRAAQLLAATRIVAQCEGTESIVEQQYRYILREYGDTPAAESIKASHNLKLGGMPND